VHDPKSLTRRLRELVQPYRCVRLGRPGPGRRFLCSRSTTHQSLSPRTTVQLSRTSCSSVFSLTSSSVSRSSLRSSVLHDAADTRTIAARPSPRRRPHSFLTAAACVPRISSARHISSPSSAPTPTAPPLGGSGLVHGRPPTSSHRRPGLLQARKIRAPTIISCAVVSPCHEPGLPRRRLPLGGKNSCSAVPLTVTSHLGLVTWVSGQTGFAVALARVAGTADLWNPR